VEKQSELLLAKLKLGNSYSPPDAMNDIVAMFAKETKLATLLTQVHSFYSSELDSQKKAISPSAY
jgi:hypothetical protein